MTTAQIAHAVEAAAVDIEDLALTVGRLGGEPSQSAAKLSHAIGRAAEALALCDVAPDHVLAAVKQGYRRGVCLRGGGESGLSAGEPSPGRIEAARELLRAGARSGLLAAPSSQVLHVALGGPLSAEQLDGIACAFCGRPGDGMVAISRGESYELRVHSARGCAQ